MSKFKYYIERLQYELLCLKRRNVRKKLFIHIPKSAGMTVRRSKQLAGRLTTVSAGDFSDPKYVSELLSKMNSIGDHHGIEHARVMDLRKAVISKHKPFAIIRNPWDRVASRYYFAKQVIEVEKKYAPDKHNISSFEAFLEERTLWGEQKYMWHRAIRGWYPCWDYVIDKDNTIICDILRFENLNADLERYFDLKRMDRARNVTATRKNTSLKDIYNPKTIQIVADWYSKDIEAFGYDFGSGPTKNCLFKEN